MPMTGFYLSPEGALKRGLTEEEARIAFESKRGLLWVNVGGTTEEDGRFLESAFGFHPLAVEDCVSPLVRQPKIDDFGDYLFLIFHGIKEAPESEIVETTELEFFLGPHFLVTNHNFPLASVELVKRMVEEDGRPMKRGADFLAHAILDALIDDILPTIDRMDEVAEEIEEEALRTPKGGTPDVILKLKRSALQIHRVIAPQREMVNRLSRGDFPLIRDEARIYYRDVYDHLYQIDEQNQALRERADTALATYLSAIANRQNETMRVIAILTSVFLPLTLVAGIYGMNFDNMPELRWPWGYFAVLGFMATVIAVMGWWFWVRRWIPRWGRQAARASSFAVEPRGRTAPPSS
ncbi:MAG: magnesium/cobalt transporter CorA [Chloroflexi bacterium]|nr:magnesium/cobalt transporter CorA [Chloroflexota bacterium]